jgi:hypothetical protein
MVKMEQVLDYGSPSDKAVSSRKVRTEILGLLLVPKVILLLVDAALPMAKMALVKVSGLPSAKAQSLQKVRTEIFGLLLEQKVELLLWD